MKAIIDGKFNPKCVQLSGPHLQLFGADGLQWTLSECPLNNSGILRAWMRETLEEALGRKLEDYAEPWRYYLDRTYYERAGSHIYVWRFRNGEGFFRWLDDPQRGWCPTTVNAEQGIQSWPVTEDEAAKMLGRSLL